MAPTERDVATMKRNGNVDGLVEVLRWKGKGLEAFQAQVTAAMALGELRDTKAVPALIEALSDHGFQWFDAVSRALAGIGDARAVSPLLALLQDPDQTVRAASARALALLGDKSATEPLCRLLRDADVVVRSDAARALGVLGDPRALPHLEACRADPNEHVRERVNWSLEQLREAGDDRPIK